MKLLTWAFLGLAFCGVVFGQSPVGSAKYNSEERKALEFVNDAEAQIEKAAQEYTVLQWAYTSNIMDYNEKRSLEYQVCDS